MYHHPKKEMKMKRLMHMTLILALVAFSGSLLAQGCPNGRGHSHGDRMKETLGLTDAQAAQMDAIHEKYRPELKALWANEGLDHEARITKMKELKQSMHAEMQAVLTPEQQAKAKALHGHHHGSGMGSGHSMHGGKGRHGHTGHAEFRNKLEPLLLAQRAKLEEQLMADDRTLIADLRSQMEEVRDQKHAAHQAMRAARQQGEAPTDAQRAQMEALHARKRAVMDQAMAIAGRYQTQIQALHDEVKPQVEAILKEMQAQRAQSMERDALDGKHHQGKASCKGKEGCKGGYKGEGNFHHGPMGQHHEMDPDRMMARFILMDPGTSPVTTKVATGAEAALPEMVVFPNPSTSSHTLRYTVAQAGQVRIELMTVEGKVLQVVRDGRQDTGTHALEVPVSELSAGTYLYRLVDASGSRVERFTVAK